MIKSSTFKFLSILLLGLTAFTGCSKKSAKVDPERAKEVIVYSYDSFVSEWGPGPEIEEKFEAATGYDLVYVNCGEGLNVLNRALLEKDNVQADIILGLDNNISEKAISQNILLPYKPKNADKIIAKNVREQLSSNWSLTPYDYSHFAFIYDTESDVPGPKCLEDLTSPVYEKKIILMDPRTSTPGLGFVNWTLAAYGDKVLDYWKALKPNILTMAPSWSTGYGLFKKGEAPLVISYTTSAASHIEYDNVHKYIAVLFEDGHAVQVEGAGILKGAPNIEGAKAFMDFLISTDAQSTIPLTQWMNPVNPNVDLPESYKEAAPIPAVTISAPADETAKIVDEIMKILE
ncbi:MAG: thiamine ABC transporter substrate-binding protein [Treponema sp.]|nr:thiamine ABC transporter substrate-binding protein [Treponema sp.]